MAENDDKKRATSKYALRKAARRAGRPMASRYGQSVPWYCWPNSIYMMERKIEKDAATLTLDRRF